MTVHRVLAQACVAACLLWIPSHAQATNPDTGQCAAADARTAATGRGDSDHDGLSDCRERKILGTSPRDFDSDDDGVADGTEVADGTNPVDADSDDDGLSDGDEDAVGSDPLNPNSDGDDILSDGDDPDPTGSLDSEIRGMITALTCPAADGTGGNVVVLGITIAVDAQTRFEGADCPSLQAANAANGVWPHAQVEVQQVNGGGLLADKISVDDANHDGVPDDEESDNSEGSGHS